MDLSDLDALLNDDPVPRQALPNGIDPWQPLGWDRTASYRDRWQARLDAYGVDVTCVNCGTVWRVQPFHAARARYCGDPACRVSYWRHYDRARR